MDPICPSKVTWQFWILDLGSTVNNWYLEIKIHTGIQISWGAFMDPILPSKVTWQFWILGSRIHGQQLVSRKKKKKKKTVFRFHGVHSWIQYFPQQSPSNSGFWDLGSTVNNWYIEKKKYRYSDFRGCIHGSNTSLKSHLAILDFGYWIHGQQLGFRNPNTGI